MISLTQEHFDLFNRDGFVTVANVLDRAAIAKARERFEPLFSGRFQTGLYPDEWNWRMGRDREDLTRQICNGWKSDLTIASIVLRADIGKAAAELRGWPGARIGQDNVIWKPPGTKPLGFHQDDSYNKWIVPGEMLTCWITLDDTRAHQGTIEYVAARTAGRWLRPSSSSMRPTSRWTTCVRRQEQRGSGLRNRADRNKCRLSGVSSWRHLARLAGQQGQMSRGVPLSHIASHRLPHSTRRISAISTADIREWARLTWTRAIFPCCGDRTAIGRHGSTAISKMRPLMKAGTNNQKGGA